MRIFRAGTVAATSLCLLLALVASLALPPVAATPVEALSRHRVGALAPELPDGFSDSVVTNAPEPTAMTWTPDRRMVITSKPGRVIVWREDGTRTVALDISARVCDNVERGLVGAAVDPDFDTNKFVYLYYTHPVRGSCGGEGRPNAANRVSRFVLGDDDTIAASSERVIVDHIESPSGHHIAGDLEFGANGFLYISVGDSVCNVIGPTDCGPTNHNSQMLRVPQGKILRVTRTGMPVASNPYADARGARRCTRPAGVQPGSGPCKEIFAYGFRNPFRFARKPGTSQFYVNDVGMHTWEEVDDLRGGRNYGWNIREGHCRRGSTTVCGKVRGLTNPIHVYRHSDCRAITGGAFVPASAWPTLRGSYLYSDITCGKIFRLERTADGGFRRSTFASGLDGPIHLRFGPDGDGKALYYLSYFTNSVRRITRTTVNSAPVADFTYRPDGLTVSFSGAASYDPDTGDRVTRWLWDFGDGTSAETTTPTTTHTYAAEGPVQVTLTVVDSQDRASTEISKTVHAGEHPPSIRITEPDRDARFAVGQTVPLTAEASDAEDGALPGSAITWTIRLRHGNHFHPYLGPVAGESVSTTYPAPEDLVAARSSRLVVTATAVDSRGLTTTVGRALLPRVVDLTFRTLPTGGRLLIQGQRRPTPLTVQSWVGYVFEVRAPDQRIGGDPFVFVGWSDGRARAHDITTPANATEYVARYRRR